MIVSTSGSKSTAIHAAHLQTVPQLLLWQGRLEISLTNATK
jgi:hypothetical protein